MRYFDHIIIGGAEAHTRFDKGTHVRLERGGLYLCRHGECDIVINMKQFHVVMGDMILFFPFSVIQVISHSEDFDGYIIGAEDDFFNMIQVSNKSSYYLYIKDNPCISPSKEELDRILALQKTLLEDHAEQDHPLRQEIDECNMKRLVYEIVTVYIRHKPIEQQHRSCQDRIFQQFIYSLFNNYHIHRSLDYYASEQSITPRYLSNIVKQISGQSAGEWVAQYTIANIKSQLQNPHLLLKQIADDFNFSSPSSFSQYFRRYTGQLPKEYRALLSNQ